MPAFLPQYAPLQRFVAPAVGRAQVWRTLLGLAIAVGVYFIALRLLATAVIQSMGPLAGYVAITRISTGTTPEGLVTLLYSYLPLALGLGIASSALLNRGLSTLIGPLGLAWRCFFWVAAPGVVFFLLLMPLQVMSGNVGRHLGLWDFLSWLPLALPALLVQTGTEELLFRGYLQQQLAARWSSPWIWMVLPSCTFGLLHWSPEQYGPLASFIVVWAIGFGLAAADLTARTGNLGAAVGLHFATNAQSIFLVGLYGNLHGLALYNVVLLPGDTWAQLPYLAIDALTLLVTWLGARLILRV